MENARILLERVQSRNNIVTYERSCGYSKRLKKQLEMSVSIRDEEIIVEEWQEQNMNEKHLL